MIAPADAGKIFALPVKVLASIKPLVGDNRRAGPSLKHYACCN